jgi:ketosteroid isomerase-like protein
VNDADLFHARALASDQENTAHPGQSPTSRLEVPMKFRSSLILAAMLAALTLPSTAALDSAAMQTVNGIVADLNANNTTHLSTHYLPNAVISDEFAPYTWMGSGAASRWWTGFNQLVARYKFTNVRSTIGTIKFSSITGDSAYAVVPLELRYTAKGKPQRETGAVILTLKRANGSWKVLTQSWATYSNTMSP